MTNLKKQVFVTADIDDENIHVSAVELSGEQKHWIFSKINTKATKRFLQDLLFILESRVKIEDINREGSL